MLLAENGGEMMPGAQHGLNGMRLVSVSTVSTSRFQIARSARLKVEMRSRFQRELSETALGHVSSRLDAGIC